MLVMLIRAIHQTYQFIRYMHLTLNYSTNNKDVTWYAMSLRLSSSWVRNNAMIWHMNIYAAC